MHECGSHNHITWPQCLQSLEEPPQKFEHLVLTFWSQPNIRATRRHTCFSFAKLRSAEVAPWQLSRKESQTEVRDWLSCVLALSYYVCWHLFARNLHFIRI